MKSADERSKGSKLIRLQYIFLFLAASTENSTEGWSLQLVDEVHFRTKLGRAEDLWMRRNTEREDERCGGGENFSINTNPAPWELHGLRNALCIDASQVGCALFCNHERRAMFMANNSVRSMVGIRAREDASARVNGRSGGGSEEVMEATSSHILPWYSLISSRWLVLYAIVCFVINRPTRTLVGIAHRRDRENSIEKSTNEQVKSTRNKKNYIHIYIYVRKRNQKSR